MTKKKHLSDDDVALFRSTVDGVTPLKQERITHHSTSPPPIPRQRENDEQQALLDMFSDSVDPADMETGEELLFSRTGLQHSVLRKLRRGQYSVAAELDLHGLRVEEARQALSQFLHHCRLTKKQCVRIIHGKGNRSHRQQPVLKGKVNHWLRQREEVLAFCSARPVDGGTGAIYVLLSRK